jgi:uncharacterized membrane protein YphA (DoxX/SURF4 family)
MTMSLDIAVLVGRVAVAYVYLYAGYLNGKSENREWLLTHTALLLPTGTSPLLIKIIAFIGVAMMVIGGVSVLLGLATVWGSALLILFTLLGYLQHNKEVQFATKVSNALLTEIKPLIATSTDAELIRRNLQNLSISAYSGQFSSGLKNWGLIGGLIFLCAHGARWFSVDQWLTMFRPSYFIDTIVWPM